MVELAKKMIKSRVGYFLLSLCYIPIFFAEQNTYQDLVSQKIIKVGVKPSLHLGCGERYLPGYINIDLPWDNRPLHLSNIPDYFSNILDLRFPPNSVMKIENHHMFEHFSRPKALGLLCAWSLWLDHAGFLIIETPDFEAGINRYLNSSSFLERQVILRHIFGSHEANWAYHYDGWSYQKFQRIFEALGFTLDRPEYTTWKSTDNVIVRAKKEVSMNAMELREVAYDILKESCLDQSTGEKILWELWCKEFDEIFSQMIIED